MADGRATARCRGGGDEHGHPLDGDAERGPAVAVPGASPARRARPAGAGRGPGQAAADGPARLAGRRRNAGLTHRGGRHRGDRRPDRLPRLARRRLGAVRRQRAAVLVLLSFVLRRWQVPTVGGSFLICVATEGLAVLAATQGAVAGSRPAVGAGFAAFLLGLVLYAVVVARFDWRQLIVGAGDQWVVAGALAITSLAGAKLVLAGDLLDLAGSVRQPLRLLDLSVWAVAVIGYA